MRVGTVRCAFGGYRTVNFDASKGGTKHAVWTSRSKDSKELWGMSQYRATYIRSKRREQLEISGSHTHFYVVNRQPKIKQDILLEFTR